MNPPRWTTWLVGVLVEARDGEEVLGDLAEGFQRRTADEGVAEARRWYRKQALGVVARLRWMGIAEPLRRRLMARGNADGGVPGGSPHGRGKERGDSLLAKTSRTILTIFRSFVRTPGFTLMATVTTAMGIGTTTLIFSVVNGVVLRPLPYQDSDQIIGIWHAAPGLDLPELTQARGVHVHYEELNHTLEEIALFGSGQVTISGDGEADQVPGLNTTASLFRVLRVPPALGRTFTEEDNTVGAPRVAILTHGLWTRRYGADPAVVGRTITLDGVSWQVVGVMPRGFSVPLHDADVFTAMGLDRTTDRFGGFHQFGMARLKPDVSLEMARADLQSLVPRLGERFVEFTPDLMAQADFQVLPRRMKDVIVGDTGRTLWILLAMVGFVLLIACGNVANLLLVRAEARQREVAIRTALGAGRGDLTRVFLTESLLLALMGGLLGIGFALGGMEILRSMAPANLPRLDELSVDWVSLTFALGTSVFSGLLFGLIPVIRFGPLRPAAALRDGSRGSTGGPERHRIRGALVMAQTAFALMLMVGSGLMVRSYQALGRIDPGFDGQNVLTVTMSPPFSVYSTPDERAGVYHRVIDAIRALPGVESAGSINQLPLTGPGSFDPMSIEDQPTPEGQLPPVVPVSAVSDGYFETLGIPLLAGRTFERADAENGVPAAVISRVVAQRFWPGENPIGKRIAYGLPGDLEWSPVVGVVGEVLYEGLAETPQGMVYFAIRSVDVGGANYLNNRQSIAIRTSVAGAAVLPAVRRQLTAIDPTMAMAGIGTMAEIEERAKASTTFTMIMLAMAAAMGVMLGMVGIYGVVSFVTGQRTREIGVRMALGARGEDVRRMVVREGTSVTLAGLALGLVGSLGMARLLEAMLFGVTPWDPVTFFCVTLLLLAVSVTAAYLPARRAATIDPMEALSQD